MRDINIGILYVRPSVTLRYCIETSSPYFVQHMTAPSF